MHQGPSHGHGSVSSPSRLGFPSLLPVGPALVSFPRSPRSAALPRPDCFVVLVPSVSRVSCLFVFPASALWVPLLNDSPAAVSYTPCFSVFLALGSTTGGWKWRFCLTLNEGFVISVTLSSFTAHRGHRLTSWNLTTQLKNCDLTAGENNTYRFNQSIHP